MFSPASTTRSRQPKILAGTSGINPSDLKGLQQAWQRGHLVIFLGAGVSIPYGIPSWRDLVLELLFESATNTRYLGSLWPHYLRAMASWMADYFDYDPLVLARLVEKETLARSRRRNGRKIPSDFKEQLRQALYVHQKNPAGRSTLQALADLIADPRGKIAGAVSFNFDDLLETELKARGIDTLSITDDSRRHGPEFRIIHPHGFIPRKGTLSRDHLVFTETDYHSLTESVFHWGLSEIISCLRNQTVLFVGLSMSDPSLRRLLDAAKNSDIPAHWQIQKHHQVRDSDMLDVMKEVQRRAELYAKNMSIPNQQKEVNGLREAIHAGLSQADTYDRKVFESMGVKTIWINEWDDLPRVIDSIHAKPAKASPPAKKSLVRKSSTRNRKK